MVDLDKLEALEKAATPGPWVDSYGMIATDYDEDQPDGVTCPTELMDFYNDSVEENKAFVVALRDAAPALIAELREARALINDYRRQASADVAQINRTEEEIVKLRWAVQLLLECTPESVWDRDRQNKVRRDLNITVAEDW